MFHNLLADFVAQVVLLDINLLKLCLLLFITGIFIVFWFKRLKKDTRGTRVQKFRLNCWFCNKDVDTQSEKADSWRCPYCDQYNGFTEEGDYNQPLTDQFEVKEFKTPTVCSQSEFITGSSVLCESCSQNQVLKLRQIAAFVPFNEASYDDEVEEYRTYLEHRYSLCDKCRKQVSNYLTDQDRKLVGKMTEDQLSLLDQLKEKVQTYCSDHQMRHSKPQQPVLPCLMFKLCVCASIVHTIFSLMLYSKSTSGEASSDMSELSHIMRLWLGVLPDWLAVWGERISAICGCAFCFWALLATGKHSLYPEDAIHLLLWLMLTLLSSLTPAAILSWLHLPQGRVLVAGTNMVLCLVCCLRSRRPRHFTVPTVHKKQMNQLEAPVAGSSRDRQASDSAHGVHKRHFSPPSALSSPMCASSDGIAQVEHVQQNMEGLTLGLTRRSASTSSVWSLPAVVTDSASAISPDSTTDRLTPSCVQHLQNILSPSKLSFLNLDSDATASGSRSPSPWMQISESLAPVSDRDYRNTVIKLNQVNDSAAHLGLAFQSHRHGPSARDGLSAGAADRSQTCCGSFRPACSSSAAASVLVDVGPCDSQTPESGHLRLSTSMGGHGRNYSGNVEGKDSNLHSLPGCDRIFVPAGLADMFTSPEPVAGKLRNNTPRRSQRIASIGKLPKPWPLKKSWSCNIVCDRGDAGRSGVWQTRDVLVSSQVWGTHFTDNKGDSTLATSLLPVQELRVGSPVCQTATTDNKDKKLKCDNFLVKRHPRRQDIQRHMTELSDDDFDENDDLRQVVFKNKTQGKGLRRNDLTWTWLLIGTVMGASLTTNVFLVCHSWWSSVEPL